MLTSKSLLVEEKEKHKEEVILLMQKLNDIKVDYVMVKADNKRLKRENNAFRNSLSTVSRQKEPPRKA